MPIEEAGAATNLFSEYKEYPLLAMVLGFIGIAGRWLWKQVSDLIKNITAEQTAALKALATANKEKDETVAERMGDALTENSRTLTGVTNAINNMEKTTIAKFGELVAETKATRDAIERRNHNTRTS